ncbi:MAG: amylo-alpha-1,6-glucosidase [Trueperaceae bacterium]|nr:amylo-alpha-1,6-glucosidase [Trueperaceae bacterium]
MTLTEIAPGGFGRNLVLKENYTFLVANEAAAVLGGEHGLYSRDTRYLSRYAWSVGWPEAGDDREAQLLLEHSPRPDRCAQHVAVMAGPTQVVAIARRLDIATAAMRDAVTVTNTSLARQTVTLTLAFETDFADLFQARGWHEQPVRFAGGTVCRAPGAASVRFDHVASDGLEQGLTLTFTPAPSEVTASAATYTLELRPGESVSLTVDALLRDPLEAAAQGAGVGAATAPRQTRDPSPPATSRHVIAYESWLESFGPLLEGGPHAAVLRRAALDLRALLLFSEHGPIVAAGIPWFVTAFGRDSILTALMLLDRRPDMARGTLRYLASLQGRGYDAARSEAPGKILHEVRQGELARTGKVPFGRYYGSIDATLLFMVLLHETYRRDGDLGLLRELRPNLEAALGWLATDADPDGDGFVEFACAQGGNGLSVQSWKDSHDALSHADGTLAKGAVAVAEVQGYAYAALLAAAGCLGDLGEATEAARLARRADELKARFHETFWLPDLGTYALALDGDKRPLEVLSSDAGQLLWTGIVPEAFAPTLAATLMSDRLFSGWGIRTLGTREARYNPLSYHNGSVWPHDTALIAAGLRRYGFTEQASTLRDALFDLAASQPDLRPPELVAGYERTDSPPVPYPVACRPQAWSSAALAYLADWA